MRPWCTSARQEPDQNTSEESRSSSPGRPFGRRAHRREQLRRFVASLSASRRDRERERERFPLPWPRRAIHLDWRVDRWTEHEQPARIRDFVQRDHRHSHNFQLDLVRARLHLEPHRHHAPPFVPQRELAVLAYAEMPGDAAVEHDRANAAECAHDGNHLRLCRTKG